MTDERTDDVPGAPDLPPAGGTGGHGHEHAARSFRLRQTRRKCSEIQPLLFDFLARELGDARADLVRNHLAKCEACRQAAAELERTLSMLRKASEASAGAGERLSADRRARVWHAYAHPVLDWVFSRHLAVSAVAALAVLWALLYLAWRATLWWQAHVEPGRPSWIEGTGVPTRTLPVRLDSGATDDEERAANGGQPVMRQ